MSFLQNLTLKFFIRHLILVTFDTNTDCGKSVQIQTFFWSVFSRIRTEYGEMRSISPYSVQMPENKDHKKNLYLDTFHAALLIVLSNILKGRKLLRVTLNGQVSP